ncbi:TetR/AcrR family transcriptional regulator [Streptomyces phaeoluteigriseus]|uniref:TetR/AcrR family transcriptional regulator n=1 Tax=Streptomyces phaeoluteigriseus TaxID=114686 RepID=A0ABY4ZBJ3_9ACTN|nr:TetR/AcrR family transcriptional regulator [Streptomyces phaeoluteigriseus]USQ86407.1 TetR/AcrR family transcriptional regulator [Streptomyces phaeoluteigriseus]
MPIEVDEARRLDEIAAATIQVARERGVRSVTIRAVAAQLGGSTAVVTNYVASRSALMINALRRAEEEWGADMEGALDGLTGEARLEAALKWMCTTEHDDEVMRRLLMEIASEGPDAGRAVEDMRRTTSRRNRDELHTLAAEAGLPDAALAGDILHLLMRGYWLTTLEDPDGWPEDRAARAALAVAALLRDAPTTS